MTREQADKVLKVFTNNSPCDAASGEYAKLVNEVISTITKSIPEKATVSTFNGDCKVYCPSCEGVIHDTRAIYYNYCPYCGQRIEVEDLP